MCVRVYLTAETLLSMYVNMSVQLCGSKFKFKFGCQGEGKAEAFTCKTQAFGSELCNLCL